VIGGVITSTLLTLLVIPTFYEIPDQLRDWIGERARRIFGSSQPKPAHEPMAEPAGGGVD
jgi:HAE1 family hydrophobic/amphiphilic exporter-1